MWKYKTTVIFGVNTICCWLQSSIKIWSHLRGMTRFLSPMSGESGLANRQTTTWPFNTVIAASFLSWQSHLSINYKLCETTIWLKGQFHNMIYKIKEGCDENVLTSRKQMTTYLLKYYFEFKVFQGFHKRLPAALCAFLGQHSCRCLEKQ